MTDSARRAIAFTLVLVLVALAAPAGTVTASMDGESGATGVDRYPQQTDSVDAETGDDDDPIRHEHPDGYVENDATDGSGDLEGVGQWLEDWMIEQLRASTDDLDEGAYDRAMARLDEEFLERLAQYEDVAAELGKNNLTSNFTEAHDNQRRVAELVREYDDTSAAYDEARENGDTERARDLAVELDGFATAVNDSSATLREAYDVIETEAETDFAGSHETIEEINRDIQRRQDEIRDVHFVETELVLTPERETISFLEPLVANGRLRTVDGEPVANEEIRLDVANETVRTETDGDGWFDVTYRPTTLGLETTTLTVEFVPEGTSAHLGSQTTVPVAVEQVDPTVTDLEVTDAVSFDDDARVAGTLAADGVPVDNVTLEVVLGDQHVGTVDVTNGRFDGQVSVPASVPAGEQDFGVRVPFDDRALAATSETAPVTVDESETVLTTFATHLGDRTLSVDGSLETNDGVALGDESIQVSVNGTATATVQTAPDGTFTENVTIPAGLEAGDDVRVLASYEGDGTNLASDETESVVPLFGDEPQAGTALPSWEWIGVGIVVIGLVAGAIVRTRRSSDHEPAPIHVDREPTPVDDTESTTSTTADVESLLTRADEYRSSGVPRTAIEVAYVALRRKLVHHVDRGTGLTHWEFYRQIQESTDAGPDDDLLLTLTQEYERAAFGIDDVTDADAESALERVHRLCESFDSDAHQGAVADD